MPPHSAKANHPNGTLAMDLTDVTFIDQAGRHLLPLTHRDGVSVVASDLMRQDTSEEVAAPVTLSAVDHAAIEAVEPRGARVQGVRSPEE